jgi:polysaccharide chain length determinant protein (PEP-CTERM system associated)
MTQPATSPAEILKLMLKEGRRRVLVIAAIFAVIAIGALVFGVLKPKEYESHATILVETKNIIAPLMEGRAVATGVTDQASIVSQVMQSRRILREILAFGGWGEEKDPRAEERLLIKLSRRIRITKPRPELIVLSYIDTDPQRAFAIAKKLAEICIREALVAKSRQSSEAFAFIDRQVAEYAEKVATAHAQVQAYYRSHEPKSANPSELAPRPLGPRVSSQELAALRAEEAVLASEVSAGELRRSRRSARVDQLQRELDTLLGTYTEQHPNVMRAREELQVAQEEARRATSSEEPTLQAARARLEQVRGRLAASNDGLPRLLAEISQPQTAEMRILVQDSTLSELLRRYESERDVYQDLLKRRENARVSMELDAEQRGLTLRVYEEPEMPLLTTGMRLMHFTIIGLFLAVAAPLGLLFAFVKFDPRVRSAQQLEQVALAPILVTIPNARTSQDDSRERRRMALAIALVGGVFLTYAVFLAVRLGMSS